MKNDPFENQEGVKKSIDFKLRLCKCGHTRQEHEVIWGDETIIIGECSYDDPVCDCKTYTDQNDTFRKNKIKQK